MKVRHLIPDQASGTALGSVVVKLNRLGGLSGGLRSHSYTLEHLVLITELNTIICHTHGHIPENLSYAHAIINTQQFDIKIT